MRFFLYLITIILLGSFWAKAQNSSGDDSLMKLVKMKEREEEIGSPVTYEVTPEQLPESMRDEFKNIKPGNPLRLDIEPDKARTLFSEPGFDYRSCESDKLAAEAKNLQVLCHPKAWPKRDAKLSYDGEMRVRTTKNPDTNEEQNTYYFKVQYEHVKADGTTETVSGYMLADQLTRKELGPAVYPTAESVATQPAPVTNACKASDTAASEIKNSCDVKFTQSLNSEVEALRGYVGKCPLVPPNKLPTKWSDQLVYDQTVLKNLKSYPKLKKDILKDGESAQVDMDRKDLIDIDAFARAIYAEMSGKCYQQGIQYPLAVARILMNRADYVAEARKAGNPALVGIFLKNAHSSAKGDLAKVSTDAGQINCWDKTIRDAKLGIKVPNVSGVTQSLCPPADPEKKFYRNINPGAWEQEIWEETLKIATNAVLHKEVFKEKTKDLKDAYFYTSGKARIPKMHTVNATVAGRKLSNKDCIVINEAKNWPPPIFTPRSPAKAKSK